MSISVPDKMGMQIHCPIIHWDAPHAPCALLPANKLLFEEILRYGVLKNHVALVLLCLFVILTLKTLHDFT